MIDSLRLWYRKISGSAKVPLESSSPAAPSSGPAECLRAVNVTKGVEIAARVEWAGTSDTRRRGLLGRDHIDADQGMYIVPTQWIHMFGMRFPIDVAFLASDGRVLYVHHNLRPNRFSRPVWHAEGALELAAGALERSGTCVGDVIELR
ncbi:MAG: DUF192 domain-containing protein [Candidatus Latescibacterota bacterium]|nr:MAG: DUF192 domain-containing protein [Candidatus Latescibacterota bacterium]